MDELLEYGIYLALLVALAIPLSGYINKVMAGEKVAVLSRVLVPVENVVYRCIRVDRADVMGWKRYLISALVFAAGRAAGQSRGVARPHMGSRVQHGGQLRDEHELAGL